MAFMSFFQLLVGPEAVRSSRKVRWLTSLRQPYHHLLSFPTSGGKDSDGGHAGFALEPETDRARDPRLVWSSNRQTHLCALGARERRRDSRLGEQRQTALILLGVGASRR